MKNKGVFAAALICLISLLYGCQTEDISTGTSIQDLFYVENQGAKMPVLVEGNMDSGVIVLWVHGGPGGTAIGFQNDQFSTDLLEPKYAVAYWDQRAAGGAQGSNTPELDESQYIEDLGKVITVLKYRYGQDKEVFLLSHSWGGLIAAGFLSVDSNQNRVKGWINVAGADNYHKNDSLTRTYLISYGQEQIAQGVKVADWQKIVDTAEKLVPDYTFKTSFELIACADQAEGLIDDIQTSGAGIGGLLSPKKTAFSLFWMVSNAGSTFFSKLNDKIMYAEYSDKLPRITLPLLCITGKYDFTVPRGMADEVMEKTASVKKDLLILPHSGHICMSNEPDAFYAAVVKFIGENRE